MNYLKKKAKLRQSRVWRIRKKINGTAERPRLCLSFTEKHIYAQAIDDVTGKTLVFASSLSKDLRDEKIQANIEGAKKLGTIFASRAMEQGIKPVVFDRHGRRYHGRIKAFAEAAREGGLQF